MITPVNNNDINNVYKTQKQSNSSAKLLDAALRKSKTATIADLPRDNTEPDSATMR
jgi:hypothetical protein